MTNQYELEQVYNYTRVENVRSLYDFTTLQYSKTDIYTSTVITSSSDSNRTKQSNNSALIDEVAEYCGTNYAENNLVCYISDIKAMGSYSTVDSAVMYTLVAEIKIYTGYGQK